MFITFEGLDFCGKSTQVKLLEDYFKKHNKKHKVIREPGGTQISEKIREILLDKKNTEMFIETELVLFSASRAQLVREQIIPLLRKNYYIIADRFHDSSIAYQGYGRGIPINTVSMLQKFVISDLVPHITFFIDIPIDEVLKRKAKLDNARLDRIENSLDTFYHRVREGYIELCKQNNRFRKINGLENIDKIHELIIQEIRLFSKNNQGKK
ncbi:dTMP kinase [Bacteroidota bacterium]